MGEEAMGYLMFYFLQCGKSVFKHTDRNQGPYIKFITFKTITIFKITIMTTFL